MRSIDANCAWFNGDYAPGQAVTLGLKLLLAAKTVAVLAFGAAKAAPAKRMIEGSKSSECPASFLQRLVGAIVLLDEGAASMLNSRREPHRTLVGPHQHDPVVARQGAHGADHRRARG
ncbi:MAG: hypothetical protein HC809_14225 [Gammaproteobacteria bacterium]|nr:hypothetical protein [Gammaproteobacteria bacterium]